METVMKCRWFVLSQADANSTMKIYRKNNRRLAAVLIITMFRIFCRALFQGILNCHEKQQLYLMCVVTGLVEPSATCVLFTLWLFRPLKNTFCDRKHAVGAPK